MIFMGFYFEIFLHSIRTNGKVSKFALGSKKESYTAPLVEIMDIPEVLNLLLSGFDKEHKGLSNVR